MGEQRRPGPRGCRIRDGIRRCRSREIRRSGRRSLLSARATRFGLVPADDIVFARSRAWSRTRLHHVPDMHAVRLVYAGIGAWLRPASARERCRLGGASGVVASSSTGPSRWQGLLDAAYFYLQTSVHPSSPSSTSLFGLAYWPDYHYYRGHVMWDIEMFALPPLVLTNPDAARALLDYRADRVRGGAAERLDVGLPRSPISVGEQHSVRRGISARRGVGERSRAPCES